MLAGAYGARSPERDSSLTTTSHLRPGSRFLDYTRKPALSAALWNVFFTCALSTPCDPQVLQEIERQHDWTLRNRVYLDGLARLREEERARAAAAIAAREAELAATLAAREAALAAFVAEREAAMGAREAELSAFVAEREAELAALTEAAEAEVAGARCAPNDLNPLSLFVLLCFELRLPCLNYVHRLFMIYLAKRLAGPAHGLTCVSIGT